jgi:hypothetical protein
MTVTVTVTVMHFAVFAECPESECTMFAMESLVIVLAQAIFLTLHVAAAWLDLLHFKAKCTIPYGTHNIKTLWHQ